MYVCFLSYKNTYSLFSICDQTFMSKEHKAKLHHRQQFCILSVVRNCVRYSQNPNKTFKIRFCGHSRLVKGWQLWTQSDTLQADEEGVEIPSKTPRRGEGNPLEDSKSGALISYKNEKEKSFLWWQTLHNFVKSTMYYNSLSIYMHIHIYIHTYTYCSSYLQLFKATIRTGRSRSFIVKPDVIVVIIILGIKTSVLK